MPKRRDETSLKAPLTRITLRAYGIAVSVVRQARRVVAMATGAAVLVIAGGGCATRFADHDCAPERLLSCVPRLADLKESLFDQFDVRDAQQDATTLSPSKARESAPEECKRLPTLGAKNSAAIDVDYRPATDLNGKAVGTRFPAFGGEEVHLRLSIATAGADLSHAMAVWAKTCPMWGIAEEGGGRIQQWMVAESTETLTRYLSGDIAATWPMVTHTAAAALPDGVVLQAWYRTNDPSAASRGFVLSTLLEAAGRRPSASALPTAVAEWSPVQTSALLPALAPQVTIEAPRSRPGGEFWSLCGFGDHGPAPLYDTLASWSRPGAAAHNLYDAVTPTVTISRARGGVDYLAVLRHEIDSCRAHLAETPALCANVENRQFVSADSAVIEGEDALRIVHRWMRVEPIQGYDRCLQGVDAIRVVQTRGLIIASSAHYGSPYFLGETPQLPLNTLDALLAETVRNVTNHRKI